MFSAIVIILLIAGMNLWGSERKHITKSSIPEIPGESIDYQSFSNFPTTAKAYLPPPWGRGDTTELFWDDGVPELYYVVSMPVTAFDRMAVRFHVQGPPPLKVVGGRFYKNQLIYPFFSFSACRDAGGYPDVFHAIDQVDSAYGVPYGWGSYDFNGALFDTNDIWAVITWIAGVSVGLGADTSEPDSQSFWTNDKAATTWNYLDNADLLLRLSVTTVTDSHDVTCTWITDPVGRFLPGDTAHPTAVFGNCGLATDLFDITFDITDSLGSTVYSATSQITLNSCEVETVTFSPEWVGLDEGMYTCKAYTSLAGDTDPANDTFRIEGLCTREIVIEYCGYYTGWAFSIIGTYAKNRKFLNRMTPSIPPPYYIRRGQIFLSNANEPLEYICVSPDDGSGSPDTTIILANATNVFVTTDRSWATFDYGDVEVTDSTDLWMIAKWPEGITKPHIGGDIIAPATGRSWRYFVKDGVVHWECMGIEPYNREWYFRLIIAVPPLGVEEVISNIPQPKPYLLCTPNPGTGPITISYHSFSSRDATLSIYDVSGRVIKRFSLESNYSRGTSEVFWDGLNEHGEKVPGGAYFVRLKTNNESISQKLIYIQ